MKRKYEDPDKQKRIDAKRAEIMPFLDMIGRIKRDHKGQDWEGYYRCPKCKAKVRVVHLAKDGHVWANCESPKCVGFIE